MKEKSSGFYQTEEDRVAAAITPMITSLPGGVDVFIRRFEEIPGAKDEHHVRLKLKVSVLSSTSFDTVLNAIRHNITSHFLTPGNWFSTEMIDTDSVEVIDPRVCYNSTTIEQSQTVLWLEALQGETRNVIVQTAHSSFILTRTWYGMQPHLISFRPEILQSSTEGALGAYISAEQPFVVMLLGFEETSSVAYGSGQVWYYLKYDTRDPSTQFFITTTENNTLVELPSMKNSFNKEFMPSLIMLDDLYQNFREITSDKPAYVVTVTGPGQTLTSLMPVSAWTNVYFIVTPDLQILNFEYFLNIHSKFIENVRIDGNEIKVWQVKYDLGNGMTYGVVRLFEHNVKYVTETHNFGCSVYGKVKTSGTETSRVHYIHNSRSTPGLYKTFIDELKSGKVNIVDVQDHEEDEWGNLIMTTLTYSATEAQLIESDIVVSVYDRKVKGYVRKRVLVNEETPTRFTLQLTSSTLNRRMFVNIQKAVSVCTLNINGAQGLVKLHRSAKVSIPGLADNDTLLQSITDGGRYNTCISTNTTDRIFIEFEGVKNVFRIVIYPGDTPTTFEVTCTDQFNHTVHYLKLTTHTRGPSFIHTNKPMHKIEVKTSDPKFEMCEIEIFGSLKNNFIAFNPDDYVLTLPSPISEKNLLYILLICILVILILSKLEDIDTDDHLHRTAPPYQIDYQDPRSRASPDPRGGSPSIQIKLPP
ncbi:uncharacterized protein LOC131954743 [Physella acuta]|uniref:uncharacterized protein LOC131954743 n=1 Tax=Physella acuta TaxID=109671 RepID=UPI0027DE582F|nr:uncharacterized protein LOC131954743 [Physella acuta]